MHLLSADKRKNVTRPALLANSSDGPLRSRAKRCLSPTGVTGLPHLARRDSRGYHGSRRCDLGDEFRPGESDVDYLVEFGAMDPYERVDAYFDMLDELRTLLGVEVDLVMVGAVKNRYIAACAILFL
jgi:hypothetical protein